MSFTGLRQEMNNNLKEITSLQDYMTVYLSTSIHDKINSLNDKFVEHLFADLIERNTSASIIDFLGNSNYYNANEYARNCINTAFRSKDIYGLKVDSWCESALKCFDNFILVLIQEKLNESVKNKFQFGLERQKYNHLIEKGEDYYIIGIGFDIIYQLRNEFKHVEYFDQETGKIIQRPISQKKIKKMKSIILENFKNSLSAIEKKIL
jgi:hypothetical protein